MFNFLNKKPDRNQIAKALKKFVESDEVGDGRKILKQHPELLSDEALDILDEIIAVAKNEHGFNFKAMYQANKTVLLSCRQIGIDKTYDELLRAIKSSRG